MTVDSQLNRATNPLVVSQLPCLDITVVIPTYNGAARIPEVLDQLKQQSGINGITWEVIVCDNNSCDLTADVVADYQQKWPSASSLRYCFVAEQGAAFARQRGVIEAHGNLVAFLDDDNIPARDWLRNVHDFSQAYPNAGAFGSQIHGNFQGTLPDGFEQIACFLAIVERGNKPHLYSPKSKILPPAAGLAVRRAAWLNAVPDRLFLNHKGKSAGLASEDLEAMLHIQKAGWEVWYNSDMVITHQIPGQRLQQDYLVTLLRCVGLSRFYIRWLGTKDWQRFFKVPAYIANDLRKLALHYLKNGPRQTHLNTVAACERSLLTSTVVSPAFLLKKAYQDFWQYRLDNAQLPERERWLQRLTEAFERRQLLLYQQQVNFLGSSTTAGPHQTALPQFEILLRLPHGLAEQSPASPASFFPTVERYGLMRTLDRRAIQQVCATLSTQPFNAVYSINISAVSIGDPSFVNFLEEQFRRHRVNPARLSFEISESCVLGALSQVKPLVVWMKKLGLRIVIDEVTHGVCDAAYVHQLSIDCLKLSKTILDSVPNSKIILSEWVTMSQQNNIQLVAKGVETQAALDQVKTLGIPYAQGYQLSSPSPLSSFQTP